MALKETMHFCSRCVRCQRISTLAICLWLFSTLSATVNARPATDKERIEIEAITMTATMLLMRNGDIEALDACDRARRKLKNYDADVTLSLEVEYCYGFVYELTHKTQPACQAYQRVKALYLKAPSEQRDPYQLKRVEDYIAQNRC
jgi:hypothetical protein